MQRDTMTSSVSVMLVLTVVQVFEGVYGGAVLKLQMVSYENPKEKLWDDSCCDQFCWGSCDHTFKFSLDLANGSE